MPKRRGDGTRGARLRSDGQKATSRSGPTIRVPVDCALNADMMSDMRTFTVRDLDRSPSVVLEASRTEGRVRIRARGGQTYLIIPEAAPEKQMTELPDFEQRRSRLMRKALPQSVIQQLDRAIAGE